MNVWEKKKWLVICGLVLLCTAGGLWASQPKELAGGQQVPVSVPAAAAPPGGDKKLCVYVTGAVVRPGIYYASLQARYGDVLPLAGGPTEQADLSKVNLARKCKDGCQIHVPARKEKIRRSSAGQKSQNIQNKRKDTAVAAGRTGQEKVNLNSASAEELEALPGIGPALARRIIRYRNTKRFATVRDLQQVPGIGPAKYKALADRLEV